MTRDLPARFFAWIGTFPLPVRFAIATAVGVNLLLAAGYAWSRPGQTIHVRLEARDNIVTASVDGRVQQKAVFEAGPSAGGVLVAVVDADGLPSLPRPSGIDSIRITDLDTGALLYVNDFSEAPPAESLAKSLSGATLAVSGGVLEARTPPLSSDSAFREAFMRIDGADWRNYAVDVTYRNITAGIIRVRTTGDGSGIEYAFRPFRHLDQRLALLKSGTYSENHGGPPVESSTVETVRSMLSTLLRPYSFVLLLLATGFGLVVVLQFVPRTFTRRFRPPDRLAAATRAMPWLAIAMLATAVFGTLVFYNYSYASHMPHVPDEVSYIFQAKVFAAGHLFAPAPPVQEPFQLSNPSATVVTDGKWASFYPFGHPLMLAVGVRIGAMWLIPPLVGAVSVVLVFAIGRRLYNGRTGMLAAVLFAASPFFLMNASNFMSHNTATFYLLVSIFCLAYADNRPVLLPLLAGVFFGLVFNTRQLSGAALIAPFGLLLLTFPLARQRRVIGAKQIVAFATGAALLLLVYLAYRYATLGDAFASDNIQSGKNVFGFSGAHSVSVGVAHERTQLTYLTMMLSNWPARVGITCVLLPFLLGTRNRWDWFFLVTSAVLMGTYTLYYVDGFMYGPRFWYETTPLLLLLTARGADMAALALASAASRARSIISGAHPPPRWAGLVVVYAFVLALTWNGWRSWAYASSAPWRGDYAPARARDLRGFNGIDDRLVRQVNSLHLKNALVLVGACPGWHCYGNVDWLNSPWLDGDVVFARDVPERNGELLQKFPDRDVYYARYDGPTLIAPYTGVPMPASSPIPDAPVRKAGTFPTPTVAVPTPINPADAVNRDERRMRDLAKLAAALEQYRGQHGAYPVSPNIQSLCTYPDDAGCALKSLLDPLPSDPDPAASYLYTSADGTQFALFALFDADAPPSACPSPLPEPLTQSDHLYCASGVPVTPTATPALDSP